MPRTPARPHRLPTFLKWGLALAVLVGCKAEIGDKCVLSTDCSTRGDRLCDTSQPDGYCTQFNCRRNSCPDEAVCVLFNASIPGCGYDDRAGAGGSRVARSFCVATCQSDEDCRGGYICGDPRISPWSGLIQDDNQTKKTCLVIPTDYYLDGGLDGAISSVLPAAPRPVCGPVGPDVPAIDAGAPRIVEGGVTQPPLVSDGGVDAGGDAGDAGDAGDGGDGGWDLMRRVISALAGRIAEAAFVILTLATLVFLALRILPGDPAALVLGDQASPAERAALEAKLHLDESMWMQYARFLRGLATLDLGDSVRRPGVSAVARVLDAIGPTASLAAIAVLLGALLGVGAAVLGAGPWLGVRRMWVDRAATALAATPLLAFAPVLTFALAARLRVVPLPGDPDAGAAGLLFASGLLALPLAAHVARVSRAALDDVGRAQFLGVARAKGGSFARVLWLHALPAAIGPIVTVLGTQLGALLGGAVVLERLFERRGLGTLILEAYASRDLPVLEAAVVFSGALFVGAQQLAAAAHAVIDPRVRS